MMTKTRLENEFSREEVKPSVTDQPPELDQVCRKPPVFCAVTEYLSEGSLRAFLHKTLPLEKITAVALDIARGMEFFIHAQGVIIHSDLKLESILIDQDFRMKIEDSLRGGVLRDPGTYRWMSPEMIKHKSYGKKVDVYSFGLILWEMISGAIPYEDMDPIQAAFAVVSKESERGRIERKMSQGEDSSWEIRVIFMVLKLCDSYCVHF